MNECGMEKEWGKNRQFKKQHKMMNLPLEQQNNIIKKTHVFIYSNNVFCLWYKYLLFKSIQH